MEVIIKNSGDNYISYLFLVLFDTKEVVFAGMIEKYALKKMIENKVATEMSHTKAIEKFWFSSQIIDNAKASTYYSLGN